MLSTCCILDCAGAHRTSAAALWVGIITFPEEENCRHVDNSPGTERAETQICGH